MTIETTGDTGKTETPLEISAQDLGLHANSDTDSNDNDGDDSLDVVDKPDGDNKSIDGKVEEPNVEILVKPAPKTWPKEMHEYWGKTDPKVQEYWETREKQMLDGLEQYKEHAGIGKTLKEVITPYRPILEAAGMDEATAVKSLLNAHYRLTQGSPEQRAQAYQELGKNLGLVTSEQQNVDPTVKALQDKLAAIENTLTHSQQRALQETQVKVTKDVEAFASDTNHPYFDEVADDIVAMIQAGKSLEDAYEKAVWANPVTRQKEMARLQTETQTKLKEKTKQEAEQARKAASTNVKGRDTRRTPTEPKGTMEDTMKDTLREIRSRTH